MNLTIRRKLIIVNNVAIGTRPEIRYPRNGISLRDGVVLAGRTLNGNDLRKLLTQVCISYCNGAKNSILKFEKYLY